MNQRRIKKNNAHLEKITLKMQKQFWYRQRHCRFWHFSSSLFKQSALFASAI
jgi:hypothetical protein